MLPFSTSTPGVLIISDKNNKKTTLEGITMIETVDFEFFDFSMIFAKLVLLKGKTFDEAKSVFEGHSYSVQYNRGKPFIVKIRLTEGEVTVVFHRERLDRVEFEFWGEKKEKENA